jgi:hypothetical protein
MVASQPVAGEDISDAEGKKARPQHQHHKIKHKILRKLGRRVLKAAYKYETGQSPPIYRSHIENGGAYPSKKKVH